MRIRGGGRMWGKGTGQDSPNFHSLPYRGAVRIYSYHLRKSMDVKLNNMSKAIQLSSGTAGFRFGSI